MAKKLTQKKVASLWWQWGVLNYILGQFEKADKKDVIAESVFEPHLLTQEDIHLPKICMEYQKGDENNKGECVIVDQFERTYFFEPTVGKPELIYFSDVAIMVSPYVSIKYTGDEQIKLDTFKKSHLFGDFQATVQGTCELLKANFLTAEERQVFFCDFWECLSEYYKKDIQERLKNEKRERKKRQYPTELPPIYGEKENGALWKLFDGTLLALNGIVLSEFRENFLQLSREKIKQNLQRDWSLMIATLSENLSLSAKCKDVSLSLEDEEEIRDLQPLRNQIIHNGKIVSFEEAQQFRDSLKGVIERMTQSTCQDVLEVPNLPANKENKGYHYFCDERAFYVIQVKKVDHWDYHKTEEKTFYSYMPLMATYRFFRKIEYIYGIANLCKQRSRRTNILVLNGLVLPEEKEGLLSCIRLRNLLAHGCMKKEEMNTLLQPDEKLGGQSHMAFLEQLTESIQERAKEKGMCVPTEDNIPYLKMDIAKTITPETRYQRVQEAFQKIVHDEFFHATWKVFLEWIHTKHQDKEDLGYPSSPTGALFLGREKLTMVQFLNEAMQRRKLSVQPKLPRNERKGKGKGRGKGNGKGNNGRNL